MPKKLKNEQITCCHFTWRVGTRSDGTYYADGRLKDQPKGLGRQSLGTKDREEAMKELKELDGVMAYRHGRADRSVLETSKQQALPLPDGVKAYKDYVTRPQVAGGSSKAWKRYRTVFDKFTKFLGGIGVDAWQQVDRTHLDQYAHWLDDQGRELATQYLELTTIKQALKHLVKQRLLPETSQFDYKLPKPGETTTYCYTTDQVAAIIDRCEKEQGLQWLAAVIVGLAHTGLRISELAGLRWSDLDKDMKFLHLPDRSRQGTKKQRANARTTKGRRGRVLPIHKRLKDALKNLPRHRDGRIFHGPRRGILKPDTVRNILIRDVLTPLADKFPRVGDEPAFEDGRVHSFRHYFCSMCADNNVSEQMLMTWLGHKHSDMVKRYYHGDRQVASQMMDKIRFLGDDDAS